MNRCRVKKNNHKQFGLSKERLVKKMEYVKGAMFVTRNRGSFGFGDVVAFYPDSVSIISVKATQQDKVSYRAEINKLSNVKVPKYCRKFLYIWWSKKRKWEFIKIENSTFLDDLYSKEETKCLEEEYSKEDIDDFNEECSRFQRNTCG